MSPRASLRALQAFSEVCRQGSVASAAGALGVSPSAVSHLLADLERTLGVSLFALRGPRAPLTEEGERLRDGLGNVFARIEAAVAETLPRSGEVRVSTPSTFATLWLLPRLPRFHMARPDTRLLLATDTRAVDLALESFDCAIRHGAGPWAGLDNVPLFPERLIVVANPQQLAEAERDLTRLPRIASRSAPKDWMLVEQALALPPSMPALVMQNRALAVQAALSGLGAAVVDVQLASLHVQEGLLAPAEAEWPGVVTGASFHLVARPQRWRDQHLRRFRDWLKEETFAQVPTQQLTAKNLL